MTQLQFKSLIIFKSVECVNNFLSLQQKDSSLEESESSGDDEKQEVTSNFKEENKVTKDLFQITEKPSRNENANKM